MYSCPPQTANNCFIMSAVLTFSSKYYFLSTVLANTDALVSKRTRHLSPIILLSIPTTLPLLSAPPHPVD